MKSQSRTIYIYIYIYIYTCDYICVWLCVYVYIYNISLDILPISAQSCPRLPFQWFIRRLNLGYYFRLTTQCHHGDVDPEVLRLLLRVYFLRFTELHLGTGLVQFDARRWAAMGSNVSWMSCGYPNRWKVWISWKIPPKTVWFRGSTIGNLHSIGSKMD